jgi:hypothetical protein
MRLTDASIPSDPNGEEIHIVDAINLILAEIEDWDMSTWSDQEQNLAGQAHIELLMARTALNRLSAI